MPQILVQVSDEMLRKLERVAPGSSRRRSRFVCLAIQKALMELEDRETVRAYRAMPADDSGSVDLTGWDEWDPKAASARRTTASKRQRTTKATR